MASKQPGRRKPATLKVLEGNPGRRPAASPPELPSGVPEPPAWLPHAAAEHYRRLAPPLAKAGLLTEVDRDALADLCVCLVRLEEAERAITERGILLDGPNGPVKNPACTAAKDYRAHLQAWAKRFGIDPYSRGALDVEPKNDPDPLEALVETR